MLRIQRGSNTANTTSVIWKSSQSDNGDTQPPPPPIMHNTRQLLTNTWLSQIMKWEAMLSFLTKAHYKFIYGKRWCLLKVAST